jgi:phosphoserine phosphatase
MLFITSPVGAASWHFLQTIRAERPSSVSACRYHQDRGDRSLRIAASPANQVVAVASGLETDLGNRRRIVDQLDTYQVEFSFQKVPPSTSGSSVAR